MHVPEPPEVQVSDSPGVAEGDGQRDAEEGVEGVALLQTVGAGQRRPGGEINRTQTLAQPRSHTMCSFVVHLLAVSISTGSPGLMLTANR